MRLACGGVGLVCLAVTGACGGGSGSAADAGADGGQGIDGGTTPASQQVCRRERILTADQSVIFQAEYTWDTAGHVGRELLPLGWDYVSEALDASTDPVYRQAHDDYFSYDYRDQVTLILVDNGADGSVDMERHYGMDLTTGRASYWVQDNDVSNGFFDENYKMNLGYDGEGRLIQQTGYAVSGHVLSATRDLVITHEYNASGQLERTTRDNAPDGMAQCAEMRDTRYYDESGRLDRIEIDGDESVFATDCMTQGIDDVPDLVIYHDYDDQNRLIQRRFDTGADGSIERRETYEYCN